MVSSYSISGMKREVDDELQVALRDLGYVRVRKNVFLAPWSSGVVDQFVHIHWFNWFGESEAVDVSLGVRHHEAHAFAKAALPYNLVRENPTDSFVSVKVGSLCGWSDRSLLYLDYWEAHRSVQRILDGLEYETRPLVGQVGDDETMFELLTRAIVVTKWLFNGAAVCAEAMLLGKRLGVEKDEVLARPEPMRGFITASVGRGAQVDDYLTNVWDRA